ncbi:hypothetical protein V7095_17865 [Bacillus thuringiensis]|uniref:hypothetical protein n=1 Tax=Bacillus thuringiensis TaxID=1428 RepID=UPI00159705D7|nr:hypothetical protein [Bacillus thuringiensis]
MRKEIKKLDNSLNDDSNSGLYSGDPAENNRGRVSRIQDHFNRLSEVTVKENYATIELPVFTIIAITQSNVMNVLEQSVLDNMMFNYTDAGLKNILAPMKSEQKEFQKHIENTYKAYEQKK